MSRKRGQPSVKPQPAESLTAEALTIGWLLAVFTALVCEVGAVAAYSIGGEQLPRLAGLLLFSALVIGLASVVVGVLVNRYRRARPPRGVAVFALAVGLLPLVIAFLQAVR